MMPASEKRLHRVGSAARFLSDVPGTLPDAVRVSDAGTFTMCLLAVASDGVLARGWPRGSRLLLDRFEEAFASAEGPIAARLRFAYERARKRFLEEALGLPPVYEGTEVRGPYASLLVAVVEGRDVHILCVGEVCAVQARALAPVAVVGPHVVETNGMHVVTRILWDGEVPSSGPEQTRLTLEAGDTLVLAPWSEWIPSFVATAAHAASGHTDMERLATVLASEHVHDLQPAFGVCALRADDLDV